MTDTSTNDPNAQMIDPSFGQDEMQQWLDSLGDESIALPSLSTTPAAQMSSTPETPNEDEEDDAGEEEDGSDGDSSSDETNSEPSSTSPDHFIVNGNRIDRTDIERLYAFDQFMRQNPDAAQRVNSVLTGPGTAQPAVSETPAPTAPSFEPPSLPEDVDIDDPAVKFMYEQQVSLAKRVFDFEQQQQQQSQQLLSNQQRITAAQAEADMETALNKFRGEFTALNEDDIATIRNEASPLLPAMMQQLPPVEALKRSMEVAGWANADMRQKMAADPEQPNPSNRQRSNTRKAKATQVSGSPRSAPKVESRPQYRNDRDMVNALAQEFADSLSR